MTPSNGPMIVRALQITSPLKPSQSQQLNFLEVTRCLERQSYSPHTVGPKLKGFEFLARPCPLPGGALLEGPSSQLRGECVFNGSGGFVFVVGRF